MIIPIYKSRCVRLAATKGVAFGDPKNIAESFVEMLPKAEPTKRTDLKPFPHAEMAWRWATLLSVLLSFVIVRSALKDAMPAFNAAVGSAKKLSALRVATDSLYFGKYEVARHKTLAVLGIFGSQEARNRLTRGSLVSTLSPIISDLQIDPLRRFKQPYRLLTYSIAHNSLPHLAFDAWTARRAVVEPERTVRGVKILLNTDEKEDNKTAVKEPLFMSGRSLVDLCSFVTVGAYGGATTYLSWAKSQRSFSPVPVVGGTGAVSALFGARFVGRLRLGDKRLGQGYFQKNFGYAQAFRDVALQVLGNRLFNVPVAVTLGGFFTGVLCALVSGPRYAVKETEDSKNFLLLGDARDARRYKKARALAPKVGPDAILKHRDVEVPPWLFALLFYGLIATRAAFIKAILQTPNALRAIFAHPGRVSDRLLSLPPRISFF